MKTYMLDTNVFDRLVKGTLRPSALPEDGKFVATHIQHDELANTPNKNLREQLLAVFSELAPELELTSTMIVGYSRVGSCRISDGKTYFRIMQELQARQSSRQFEKRRDANIRDAIIAATCRDYGYTLITADTALAAALAAVGGIAHLLKSDGGN